jgi:DNA (cytosine-5)-methyltransferase 1
MKYSSLEICAGGGGQALGLEKAGFSHVGLVEIEVLACQTLLTNRPKWNVINHDLKSFNASSFKNVDLLAGGVPCPPFSYAGLQLGQDDERDLFPEAIRIAKECNPKAILLENVKGLLDEKFKEYRNQILEELLSLGYIGEWKLLNASSYGVSQLRPRAILVAMKKKYWRHFEWPVPHKKKPINIGELLYAEISSLGWSGAEDWKNLAKGIAPTLVGGSKKHGGADLGPTRSKKAWDALGVNGHGLADSPPINGFVGKPKLTLKMAALVQGFPKNWIFREKKHQAIVKLGMLSPHLWQNP